MTKKHFKSKLRRLLGVLGLMALLVGGYTLALLKILETRPPLSATATAMSAEGSTRGDPHASEELLSDRPAVAGTSVLVSLSSGVDESGAWARIQTQVSPCSPTPNEGPLRHLVGQERAEAPSLLLKDTLCLQVSAAYPLEPPSDVYASWSAPATDDLPDFDAKVVQWGYLTPEGAYRKVYALSVGYCESETGGCSSALSHMTTAANDHPFVRLFLPKVGNGPLYLGD